MSTVIAILIGGIIGAIVGAVIAALAAAILGVGPLIFAIIQFGSIGVGGWLGYQRVNASSTY